MFGSREWKIREKVRERVREKEPGRREKCGPECKCMYPTSGKE